MTRVEPARCRSASGFLHRRSDGAEGDAKANGVVPEPRRAPGPEAGPAALCAVAPTAATKHPERAVRLLVRFHFGVAPTGQLLGVDIAAPFEDVAVDVEEAPRIRFLPAHPVGVFFAGC